MTLAGSRSTCVPPRSQSSTRFDVRLMPGFPSLPLSLNLLLDLEQHGARNEDENGADNEDDDDDDVRPPFPPAQPFGRSTTS